MRMYLSLNKIGGVIEFLWDSQQQTKNPADLRNHLGPIQPGLVTLKDRGLHFRVVAVVRKMRSEEVKSACPPSQ